MGTQRTPRSKRFQGLGILDPRFGPQSLRANGPNADDSSYVELDTRAGVPTPNIANRGKLVIEANGPQRMDGSLEIVTSRAGHPLPEAGGFFWREANDHPGAAVHSGSKDLMGHDGYQVITRYQSLVADNGAGFSVVSPILRLQSDQMMLVNWTGTSVFDTYRMVVDTGVWTIVSNTILSVPGLPDHLPDPELLELPSGRVLMFIAARGGRQVHVFFTDDDGVTWADYGVAVLRGPVPTAVPIPEINWISASIARGVISLFIGLSSPTRAPGFAQQYVSHDLGGTFDLVGGEWTANTGGDVEQMWAVSHVGLPSGQHVLAYWHAKSGVASTERYSVRIFDPSQPAYDANRNDLFSVPVTADPVPQFANAPWITMWADEDGSLYILLELEDAQPDLHTRILRSLDGGATWRGYKTPVFELNSDGVTKGRPNRYRVASLGGRAHWSMRWVGTHISSGDSLAVCSLGGYAQGVVGIVEDGTDEFDANSFMGWAGDFTLDRFGRTYIPIEDPIDAGWVAAGAGAGVRSAGGNWRPITTANTKKYRFTDPLSKPENETLGLGIQMQINSAGSSASLFVAALIKFSDWDQAGAVNANFVHELQIKISSTGFQLGDNITGASLGSFAAIDMTTPTWIYVFIKGGKTGGTGELCVLFGKPEKHARTWERRSAGLSLTNDAGVQPTVASFVEWGHIAASTEDSEWMVVGWGASMGPFRPRLASNFISSWANPSHLHGNDYPTLQSYLYDGVRVRAIDGPTRINDSWQIDHFSDHSVLNMFPTVNASPRVPHRTKGHNVASRYVFDLDKGAGGWMGNKTLVFGLFGCNIREATIRGWTGGVPTILAEMSARKGYQNLRYESAGSTVRPDNLGVLGGAEQYFWHHQHEGDTWEWNDAEVKPTKIIANTEGVWFVDKSGTALNKQPTIWLDKNGLPTSPPATGSGEVWSRDFVAIVREYDGKFDRISLEIAAHETADGYYQLGTLFMGYVLVFGQQPDLGWVNTREHNTEVFERIDGTRRHLVRGPSRRMKEISFANAAFHMRPEQAQFPDPDWLADGPASLPVASRNDVIRAVQGALDYNRGSALPMIYLSRIPVRGGGVDAWEQQTNRRLFMLSTVGTNSKLENVAARTGEGVDEIERLNKITLEEVQ